MDGLGANMGMLGRVPGMKNVAMAKQLRKQMAQGGMPGMGMPGLGGFGLPGMPGMGMPGMGMPGMMAGGADTSLTKMRTLSAAEKNARKAARKREKDARKRNRR
jgi:signal recognition particle subunit SRP54